MSFILEALKKSDKKHQEGAVPTLATSHPGDNFLKQKRSWWTWPLLLVLSLNAAVLLWLFGPWANSVAPTPQPAEPSTQTEALLPLPPVPSIPIKDVLPLPIAKDSSLLEERPLVVATENIAVPPVPENVSEAVVVDGGLLPVVAVAPPVTESVAAQQPEAVAPEPRIYDLSSLPLAVRQDLPDMHISLHAYYEENPAARLVSINNQLLREGGRLSGKYLLEEITAEGMIFSYAGYRFEVLRKEIRR